MLPTPPLKALVTGGAGFIGSTVIRMLRAEGAHVSVLDNLSSGCRANLAACDGVRFIHGDVRDRAAVAEALRGATVVFHLAASVGNRRSIEDPVTDSQINALGTLTVLEAMRATGVGKIVYSSSAAIFGELKTLPIAEDHPVEPRTPYGVSKLAGEKMCLAYARLYGLEAICLRYFNVYGPHQRYDPYGSVIPIFAHRLLAGEPLIIFGDGEQTRDLVNVRDVAQANVRAARARGVSGAFNIANGTRVTINELAARICDAAGVRGRIEHGAPRQGDVRHSVADIRRAAEAFGYAPAVTLDEGLLEFMASARQAVV